MIKFIVIGGGCYGLYHSGQLYKAIQKGKLPPDTQLVMIDRNAQPPAMAAHQDKPNFQFVQSDWQAYLQEFMADPTRYDPAQDGENVQIVPPPYAPHLFFDWLRFATARRLAELGLPVAVEREGFGYKFELPYEFINAEGNHFLSRAGWTCPSSCIEPRVCPGVKGLRDWDLDEDLRRLIAGKPVLPSVSAAAILTAKGHSNGQTALLDLPPAERPAQRYSGVETFKCHHFMHGIGTVAALRLIEARDRTVALAQSLSAAQPEARVAVGTVSHCHGVVATLALKRG